MPCQASSLPAALWAAQTVPFETILPCTSRPTVVVPVVVAAIVTNPVFDIEKSVEVEFAVEEPIAKSVVAVSPLFAAIENLANGDEVHTPSAPEVGSKKALEVAGKLPKRRPPMLRE